MDKHINRPEINDTEIALIDTIKAIIEIMLARDMVLPNELDFIFKYQCDGYLEKKMPNAALVMELLKEFVANRSEDRSLLKTPPAGFS